MFMERGSSLDIDVSLLSFAELKPPFSNIMYHSASSAAKDQLLAESSCFADMVKRSLVGALTDLLSIHLLVQVEKVFVITSHVVESISYLKRLLTLLIPADEVVKFCCQHRLAY